MLKKKEKIDVRLHLYTYQLLQEHFKNILTVQ